ncbi:hypothetical protein EDB85DRAFT_2193783 [Lactarius pseudohatsudake]|nr:hypothetical protein EDB85DRAFT_2193783 [Lactarius pseudohatsudake]
MALVLQVSNAPPSKQPLLLLPLNHTLKEQQVFMTMTTIPCLIASHSKQPLLLLPLNHALKEQRAVHDNHSSSHRQRWSRLRSRHSYEIHTHSSSHRQCFSHPPRERAPCASNVSPIGSLSPAVNQDVWHVPSLQEHAEVLAATADAAKRQAQGCLPSPSHLSLLLPHVSFAKWLYNPCAHLGVTIPSQQPMRPDAQPCVDSSHLAEVNKPPQTSPTLPSLLFLNARNKNPYPFGRVPAPVAAGKGFYGYG